MKMALQAHLSLQTKFESPGIYDPSGRRIPHQFAGTARAHNAKNGNKMNNFISNVAKCFYPKVSQTVD